MGEWTEPPDLVDRGRVDRRVEAEQLGERRVAHLLVRILGEQVHDVIAGLRRHRNPGDRLERVGDLQVLVEAQEEPLVLRLGGVPEVLVADRDDQLVDERVRHA